MRQRNHAFDTEGAGHDGLGVDIPGEGVTSGREACASTMRAFMATGMSMDEAITALLGSFHTSDVAFGVLDAVDLENPAARHQACYLLATLAWKELDYPRDIMPALAAKGLPLIDLLQASNLQSEAMVGLAGMLSDDPSLVRHVARYADGGRAMMWFGHPSVVGCRPGLIFPPGGNVAIVIDHQNPVLWMPKSIQVQGNVALIDRLGILGAIADLSVYLDALEVEGKGKNEGKIDLTRLPNLTTLPQRVVIPDFGVFNLQGTKIRSLPRDFHIGAEALLDLRGCTAWDGVIPVTGTYGKGASVRMPDGTITACCAAPGVGGDHPVPSASFAVRVKGLMAAGMGRNRAILTLAEQDGLTRDETVAIFAKRLEATRAGTGTLALAVELSQEVPAYACDALDACRVKSVDKASEYWHYRGTFAYGRQSPTVMLALPRFTHIHSLDVSFVSGLTTLPEGGRASKVALDHCDDFMRLPSTLAIDDLLTITQCPKWDGIVPPGVTFKRIRTGDGPLMSYDEWRAAYGFGPSR